MAAAAAPSADTLKAKLEAALQATSVSVVDTSGCEMKRLRRAPPMHAPPPSALRRCAAAVGRSSECAHVSPPSSSLSVP